MNHRAFLIVAFLIGACGGAPSASLKDSLSALPSEEAGTSLTDPSMEAGTPKGMTDPPDAHDAAPDTGMVATMDAGSDPPDADSGTGTSTEAGVEAASDAAPDAVAEACAPSTSVYCYSYGGGGTGGTWTYTVGGGFATFNFQHGLAGASAACSLTCADSAQCLLSNGAYSFSYDPVTQQVYIADGTSHWEVACSGT